MFEPSPGQATVVLGYLLLHKKMTLRAAFGHVYEKRPCVWPNDAFMGALIALEKKTSKAKKSTITKEEYTHWGDWEGDDDEVEAEAPAATGEESSSPPVPPRPMLGAFGPGPPRLKREDTGLEQEMKALTIAQALANGEIKAAIIIERAWRRHKMPVLKKNKSSGVSFRIDTDSMRSDGSGKSYSEINRSSRGSRRGSVSPAQRKANAKKAHDEAALSRQSSHVSNASSQDLGFGSSQSSPRVFSRQPSFMPKPRWAKAIFKVLLVVRLSKPSAKVAPANGVP